MLGEARVKGVPVLVHEQQVQTHNRLTSFAHLSPQIPELCTTSASSHVWFLNQEDIHFSTSLVLLSYWLELLIVFVVGHPWPFPVSGMEYLRLVAHRDALRKMGILHRDISLFNLFLVMAMQSTLGVDFVDRVLDESRRTRIREKVQKLSCRGLLGDWGYAVPIHGDSSSDKVPPTLVTPPMLCVIDQTVQMEPVPVSPDRLHGMHSIIIPMANQPLPNDSSISADESVLQRTVCP